MAVMKQIVVECIRVGEVIARYRFGLPSTLGPSVPPSHDELVNEAKMNLANQRIAGPPYAGITFNVLWP